MSPQTAWTTMAESTARGSGAIDSTNATSTTTTMRAVARPTTWELPPARATAAVFDRLPATPRPPESPAPTLAAPDATSSWFESTR